MEDDAVVGLSFERAIGAKRMQVHVEPEIGAEPLHDDDEARMEAADRGQTVLLLGAKAEPSVPTSLEPGPPKNLV